MTGFATGMVAGALWLVFFIGLGLRARKSPGHPFKSIRKFRSAGRTLQMDVPSALNRPREGRRPHHAETSRGRENPERRLRAVADLPAEGPYEGASRHGRREREGEFSDALEPPSHREGEFSDALERPSRREREGEFSDALEPPSRRGRPEGDSMDDAPRGRDVAGWETMPAPGDSPRSQAPRLPEPDLPPPVPPFATEAERRQAMAAASEPAHSSLLDGVRPEAPPASWPGEPAPAVERPAEPLRSDKERSQRNRAKPEKARREKPPKEGKRRGEKEAGSEMHDQEKATKHRLSREERKAAKAAALLESLDRQLPAIGGGPPIQRPLNDPTRLSTPIQPPAPPSLAEWSKSFAPPAAWTEPIATTYVQKRAMLAAMKGAKDDKNATSQPGTANEPRAATSQAGRLAPRFGAPKKPEPFPPLPPPVVTSRPVMGDLSRPRFAAPFNYPTSGGTKPSYPTVQPNKTVGGWSSAAETTAMLNPYFRKYAKPIEPEEKAVPYWQRKLENPNASQQIRLIAQNWIMRTVESKTESDATGSAGAEAGEEMSVRDIMAPVPTNVWLPKLPQLPEPRQEEPPAEAVQAAETGEAYEAGMRAPAADLDSGPEERADEYLLREETYSSAERWTSLKDFEPQEEELEQPSRREAESDEDLDWESMVRKPKLSRRKRRKAAEADWAPPSAELEFREPEPAVNGREPEYELREPEPEIRRRRGARGRRRGYEEEALPAREYLGEAGDVERARRIPGPDYDPEEERAAARHREAVPPAVDRYAHRATGEFEVPVDYPEPPRRRRRPAPQEPELGYRDPEPVRSPRQRRSSGRDTELLEIDRFAPMDQEPEIVHEEVRRPSRAGVEAERAAGRPAKVKASRSATLVEDGLSYVLVDDEGRAVLN